jgi:hypothetical protein
LAGRAAKVLPAELNAMAGDGMDMILLQECGVHETDSQAFRELIQKYAGDGLAHGPWSVHYEREYCTLVSHRRIDKVRASIRNIWEDHGGSDPRREKKRWRTYQQLEVEYMSGGQRYEMLVASC